MNQAERYLTLCKQIKNQNKMDCAYHAAFYLLSSDQKIYQETVKHISDIGVDFTKIKRDCKKLGDMEQQVVDIAHNLFSHTSKCAVSPHGLTLLGYPYMAQVTNALFIAANQFHIEIQQEQNGIPSLKLNTAAYENAKTVQSSIVDMLLDLEKKATEQHIEGKGCVRTQSASSIGYTTTKN